MNQRESPGSLPGAAVSSQGIVEGTMAKSMSRGKFGDPRFDVEIAVLKRDLEIALMTLRAQLRTRLAAKKNDAEIALVSEAAVEAAYALSRWYDVEWKRIAFDYLRRCTPGRSGRGRGRPATPMLQPIQRPLESKTPTRRGRRPAMTADVEHWFLREIEAWKKRLRAKDLPCTDSAALRASIASHHIKQLRERGVPEEDARRIANAEAKGATFRTRKVDLSRLRRHGRIRPRNSK